MPLSTSRVVSGVAPGFLARSRSLLSLSVPASPNTVRGDGAPVNAFTPAVAGAQTASDVSVPVAPRLLIAAAQPYQTVAGPALTVNFLHQPQLLPFQRLPFTHSCVAPFYFHALLHTLAEFAETPRPTRHSPTRELHAPLRDFWRAVGVLNQFSCTTYEANLQRLGEPPSSNKGFAEEETQDDSHNIFTHPSLGAIELSRTSYRAACDVRLTLYREDYKPLAAMVMTGEEVDSARHHARQRRMSGDRHGPTFASLEPAARRRTPLPHVPIPTEASAYLHQAPSGAALSSPSSSRLLREAEASLLFPAEVLGSAWVGDLDAAGSALSARDGACGGLYGPLIALGSEKGFAQRAAFTRGNSSHSGHTPASPCSSTTATVSLSSATAVPEDSEAAVVVPPWAVHALVADLCAKLEAEGSLQHHSRATDTTKNSVTAASTKTPSSSPSRNGVWSVCAYDCQQSDDAFVDEPVELVVAPPRAYVEGAYRVPAWRHRIGEPSLGPERPEGNAREREQASGAEVTLVALKLEARQRGRVFLDGTFFCRRHSHH